MSARSETVTLGTADGGSDGHQSPSLSIGKEYEIQIETSICIYIFLLLIQDLVEED